MKMGKVLLMMLTTGPVFAFASDGVFGDAAGMARAQKIDLREISVDGGPVMLNAAYCFQVWNGPRPDYPSGEGGDLANLREYLEQQGDSARLAHLDWIVDFAIRFDQDVAKGDVALYGQLDPLFPNWVNFNETSGIPALKANEEFRLLNVDFITYGLALEMLENFNCGVNSRLYGTTITVELRLYDPTGAAEPLTIASCRHTFERMHQGNWFDAHVAEYSSWPGDAACAFGGFWKALEPLDQVASVACPGELDVDAGSPLGFSADEARAIGFRPDETVVETKIRMEAWSVTNLPPVSPSYKGGVLLAEDGGFHWYYGLAKVGAKNEWVRLDGPDAEMDSDSVDFKMAFRQGTDGVVVKYVIGGIECTYAGLVEIPVIADGVVKRVGYVGEGTVYSLFASSARPRHGAVIYVK